MLLKSQSLLYRRQARAIMLAGCLVAVLSVFFGAISLTRFHEVETAWEKHNARTTAIAEVLAELNRQLGYGGFIHNLKNLVLRRDSARYQAAIEGNISNFRVQLDRFDALLHIAEDKESVAQVRTTFEEYVTKYLLIKPMVATGATSAEIDNAVKVDDGPALKALAQLSARSHARAQEAQQHAQNNYQDALHFARIGGLLVIFSILLATSAMMTFLRRIVAANHTISKTQARLDTLLDTAPDPMLSVTAEGHIVRTNQMAEQFFGYTRQELLTMQVEQLMPEGYRAAHAGQRGAYFNTPKHRTMGNGRALLALTRDGRQPNVEISLSHSGTGKDQLATITIRDVTEREQNQRALEQAQQKAEQALEQQQKMQSELVQAEKLAALGGLVAGVAHEINTPVGITLSAATHLEAETHKVHNAYQAGDLTEERLADYFATARQASQLMTLNSERAANLIQSFKQVAVDQTGGEQRRFELAPYIDEVLLSLRPRLKKWSGTVHVDCPAKLVLDSLPGALSQVITNLIMNSLTHAFAPEQSGHIDIVAKNTGTGAEVGNSIEIIYRDNGCGIAPELHNKVFEPFFTTQRSSGGSGLGLHIVHAIVTQSLKGSLAMSSTVGQGTVFTIILPRILVPSPQEIDQ